jgi:ParB-like chromosome segregation protein Spo0J
MTIDQEFKALIPPLSEEEFEQLEQNILKDGVRDSLVIWDNNGEWVLIDGHNRYEIAKKHNLPYNTKRMTFDSRDDVKEWIILNQFGRRNLPAFVRAQLALKLKPIIAERAREKMINAPQKKVEREKEIKEIFEKFPYDTAENLAANKRKQFADEDRRDSQRNEKYIYFARFDKDKLKIGSSINPQSRIEQLSVSCPGIELAEIVLFGTGAEKHENAIKKKFAGYQIGNECYQCPDEILKQMIAYTRKEAARKDNTDYQLAKIAGVSHDTIHKVEVIQQKAPEEIREKVKSGELSINQGYRQTVNEIVKPKDFIQEVREQHEQFEESKKENVVSFQDIQQDNQNKMVLAIDLYKEICTAARQFDKLSLLRDEDDYEILWNNLDREAYGDLYSRLSSTKRIINSLMDELERRKNG